MNEGQYTAFPHDCKKKHRDKAQKKMPARGRHFSFFVQLGMKRENLYGLDKPFGNLVIIGRLLDMTGQKAFPMF
jgi:hypothetical protein